MPIIVDDFKAKFPKFDCLPDAEIEAAAALAECTHGDFCQVTNPKVKELMMCLALAHELTLSDKLHSGGQIKRIKNQADEIEYATGFGGDPYGLGSTYYGAKLQDMIDMFCGSTQVGFTVGGFASCYTSDIGYIDSCGCDW